MTLTRRRAAGLLAATALLLPALPALPAAAQGFTLFGIDFFGGADDDEELSPDAIRYEVAFVVTDESVSEGALRNASALYSGRDEPALSTPALLSTVRGDYARLVSALYAQGRYAGVVTITVNGQDPLDLMADAVLPEPVPIRIVVDPGPPFVFGDVTVTGAPPRDGDDELPREDAGLIPGAPAESTRVFDTEDNLIARWRDLGHPTVDIASRNVIAQHATNTLDVDLTVAPGPFAVFGPVTVTGTEHMDPDFVAWYTGIAPGTPFDPDDIELANAQLGRLGVFQSARVTEADAVTPEGTLPLTVAVAERPRRAFGAGASYSTVDGATLESYFEHRNLFGHAERLRLEAEISGIGAEEITGLDSFDYFVGATFVRPGVFTPFSDLTASLEARQRSLPAYFERSINGSLGISYRFSDQLTGSVAAAAEVSRIATPLARQDFIIASLPGTLLFDSRDDALAPTEGARASLLLEPFYEANYGNFGAVAEIDASTYYALDDNERFVVAVRGAIGSILGVPSDEFPSNRLFFAGGGGSIRGYAYRNVGPRLPSGEVVGGLSYVEGSVELRARVTDNIGIVPFVDVGNAFASSVPDFSEGLRVGAGVGLRYYTALGPLRLDVAVPLNPEAGDPSFAIYLGIGHSF